LTELEGIYDNLLTRTGALSIPEQIVSCLPLSPEEAQTLYQLLYKILDSDTCAIKKTGA
jgi:hypothetical protein